MISGIAYSLDDLPVAFKPDNRGKVLFGVSVAEWAEPYIVDIHPFECEYVVSRVCCHAYYGVRAEYFPCFARIHVSLAKMNAMNTQLVDKLHVVINDEYYVVIFAHRYYIKSCSF